MSAELSGPESGRARTTRRCPGTSWAARRRARSNTTPFPGIITGTCGSSPPTRSSADRGPSAARSSPSASLRRTPSISRFRRLKGRRWPWRSRPERQLQGRRPRQPARPVARDNNPRRHRRPADQDRWPARSPPRRRGTVARHHGLAASRSSRARSSRAARTPLRSAPSIRPCQAPAACSPANASRPTGAASVASSIGERSARAV